MNIWRIALVLMVTFAMGSGCAKPDWVQDTLVTADVTGAWVGWLSKGGLNAEVWLDLDQQGQKVRGNFRSSVSSNYGFEFPNGPLVGAVNGDVFTFAMTKGGVTGEMTANGDEMQGYANAGSRAQLSLRRVSSSPRPSHP